MRIIGMDLAITSAHKAVVMDGQGKFLSPILSVTTRAEALTGLLTQARSEASADEPVVVVIEPTGLVWLPVAIYLLLHGVVVYLVNSQQVADLRRFYQKHAKSDRIDARVLAKLYLIAQEKLHPLLLPEAKLYTLQRRCKQVDWLVGQIIRIKNQIQGLDQVVWLGGWEELGWQEPFSAAARWCREHYYNPYGVVQAGREQILKDWQKSELGGGGPEPVWIAALVRSAQEVAAVYGPGSPYVDFADLQAEMGLKQKWLSHFEADLSSLRQEKVRPLYHELHPSGNLESLYGVGEDAAAVYLSSIANPLRFASGRQCRSWSGMIPKSSQSSQSEAKGLHISQAGPALPRKFLYLGADTARRFDPQLAKIYYDQRVHKGKHHTQAVCTVATHLLDRILRILKEDRPYELRDVDGTPVTPQQARQIIAHKYTVPEEVRKRNNRQARRDRKERQAERQHTRQERKRESSPEWVRG